MNVNSTFAVIFDMDGVIIDNYQYHLDSTVEFVRRKGFNLTPEVVKNELFGRTNADWISDLYNNKISLAEAKVMGEEKEALYREMYAGSVKPVQGLPAFLQMLKNEGVPTALATSAPRSNVDFILNALNLVDFFDAILDESFVENGKPDPEIYLKAAAAIGFEPQHCVVIEDSRAGIESASRAGCKVIGLATTHTRQELPATDKVADHFGQLEFADLVSLFKK
jgi:HAD superfamily hydrolase (TIGR01509 family)